MPSKCPTRRELDDFRTGAINEAVFARVAAHLEPGCTECNAVLQSATAAPIEQILCAPADTASFRLTTGPTNAVMLAGKYKLIEVIGEGGMGTVYMAQQIAPVRRVVAVKLIKPGMDSKAVLARFEAERQALALMDHPNIARIFDAGTTEDGRPFFVMELVKGTSIVKYCDEKKLTPRARLQLFVAVCQAVQHAHQKGVIHRDLKPGNVLVALYDGRPVPKVIDFGVSKAAGQPLTDHTMMTSFGSIVGTLEYMAPEQAEINQLDIDTRADVYALGVLLYELLTGSTPLEQKRLSKAAFLEVLRMVREEQPPRPSTRLSSSNTLPAIAANRQMEPRRLAALIRGELDWIVMKCLEKDRARRYETANSLARDLERYLADEPIEARPPSSRYRLRKFIQRYRAQAIAAALILVTLLAGAGVSVWQAWRATRAEAITSQTLARLEIQHTAARDELANREAVQQFFVDKIFAAGRPEGLKGGLGPAVTLRQAVDAAVASVGEVFRDRPVVEAAVRCEVGKTYLDLGEYPRAIEQFQRARDLRAAHLGRGHLETIRSHSNLAQAHALNWNMAVTPRLHEEAYALFKEKLGPDDRETLRSMTGLGDAYGRAHRADDSVRILEESTARMRANLGDEDPDTLDAMEALARAYQRVRRQKEAVTLLETIVRIQRHRHGPSHALTAMSVSNLAVAYGIVGRIAEEITLLEEVAPIVQAKFGAMHPETWQLSHNLAHAYALAERPAHEVHVRQQMLDNIQRVRKVTDIDRISAMFDLAEAFEHAGRRGDAIRMLTETLAIERSALGDLDSNTLACMIRLATLLHLDGQSQGAQPLVKEFMRSLVGVNENRFVEHLGRAGRELVSSNPQVAEPLLRHCLSIRLRLAPQEWKCFATRSLLGEALAGQQQYAEAEPELLAAYDGLLAKVDQIPERSRRELADAAGRLVRLYALLDNLPESKKWKAQEVKHREAPW